jgi:hypothetical protein
MLGLGLDDWTLEKTNDWGVEVRGPIPELLPMYSRLLVFRQDEDIGERKEIRVI